MTQEKAAEMIRVANLFIPIVARKSRTRRRIRGLLDVFNADSFVECMDWDYGERNLYPEALRQYRNGLSVYGVFTEALRCPQSESRPIIELTETCLRIACDLVVKQSAGVLGYSMGDLRRAFNGQLPEYVINSFDFSIDNISDDEAILL